MLRLMLVLLFVVIRERLFPAISLYIYDANWIGSASFLFILYI